MKSLLDLAPEILIDIVRALARPTYRWDHEADASLYMLARTCRTLYTITEPYLYTKFIQTNKAQVPKFMRTVLEKPQYRARVKMVRLEEWSDVGYRFIELDSNVVDSSEALDIAGDFGVRKKEIMLFLSRVEEYDLYESSEPRILERSQWISGFNANNAQALFSILVLSLPNLETLEMYMVPFRHRDGAPERFFQGAITVALGWPDRFLTHIKEIRYDFSFYDATSGMDYVDFFSLSRIQSLRRFPAVRLGAPGLVWFGPVEVGSQETQRSRVGNGAWSNLLGAVPNLRTLQYDHWAPDDTGDPDTTPDSIGAALTLVKNTLVNLSISGFYAEKNRATLGSLHDFPRLEIVNIQIALLVGTEKLKSAMQLWEMLPESLKQIEFYGGETPSNNVFSEESRKDISEQIIQVVVRKDTHFPCLERIRLGWGHGSLIVEPPRADLIREICMAKGVGCEW